MKQVYTRSVALRLGLALAVLPVSVALGQQNTDVSLYDRQLWWCFGFLEEVAHQATNDGNQVLYNWADARRTAVQEETLLNPAAVKIPEADANTEYVNGGRGAGLGLWDLPLATPYETMQNRQFVLIERRPKEQFCEQVASRSAAWIAANKRLLLSQ